MMSREKEKNQNQNQIEDWERAALYVCWRAVVEFWHIDADGSRGVRARGLNLGVGLGHGRTAQCTLQVDDHFFT